MHAGVVLLWTTGAAILNSWNFRKIRKAFKTWRWRRMTGKIPLDLYDVLISSEQSLNCKSRIPSLCSGCSNESCYFANINKMLMMIDSSAKTLCISMYIFSHQQILWAVREAHERGVKVRVIIDHRMIQRNSLLHKLLHNRGLYF